MATAPDSPVGDARFRQHIVLLWLGQLLSAVGDQLHPEGKIDLPTYELIGSVYREVEKKEPWCRGAAPLVDIAVFSPEP